MPHPAKPQLNWENYIRDTVSRLGRDRALRVLYTAAAIWDEAHEPNLARTLREAIVRELGVQELEKEES